MIEKTCSKCGEVKWVGAFGKSKRSKKDGRRGECKACASLYAAAYYKANSEALKGKSRAYHAANREALNGKSRVYYEVNRGPIGEQKRAYYEANRETLKGKSRAYREGNEDAVIVRRAARSFGIPEKLAAEMVTRSCEICGLPSGSNARRHHIDHDHSMEGIESVRGVLCSGCNVSLGFFEKGRVRRGDLSNPLWVASADAYLRRHEDALVEF